MAGLSEKEKETTQEELKTYQTNTVRDSKQEETSTSDVSNLGDEELEQNASQIEVEVEAVPEEIQEVSVETVKVESEIVQKMPEEETVEDPAESVVEDPAESVAEDPAESVAEDPAESVVEDPAESVAEDTQHHVEEAHNLPHGPHHSHHHTTTEVIPDEYKHPYLAVFLTTISALAATVGGAFVVFVYPPSSTSLSFMLSFSAGIMLYVVFSTYSFLDLLHGHHGARSNRSGRTWDV